MAPMTTARIEQLIAQRVAEALAAAENSRETGSGSQNRRLNNGGNNNLPGCTYENFQKCKPQSFNGTEGAVGLLRWFEKLESVFRVSNCAEGDRVKYATCTLLDGALTWWNIYARSVGIDAANATPWEEVKRMMTEKYCPRTEVQKLEVEFWNLKVQGTNMAEYTNRYHELALLCPTMVTPGYKGVERYIWGLPPPIQGMVTSSKPENIQSAIRMAHDLMDQAIRQGTVVKTVETRSGEMKRKWEGNVGSSGKKFWVLPK